MASMFINELDIDHMPVQGTNISEAIRKSVGILLFYLSKNQQFFDHRFSDN